MKHIYYKILGGVFGLVIMTGAIFGLSFVGARAGLNAMFVAGGCLLGVAVFTVAAYLIVRERYRRNRELVLRPRDRTEV